MSHFLSEVQLQKRVPSVFATGGSDNTSNRYGFIPTIEVMRGLQKTGYYPIDAMQSRARISGRKEFVRHMIRFRHESCVQIEGLIPEIVMINSHDGSTSYQIRAGIYRFVCGNGLVIGNDLFCQRIKHQGDVTTKVIESADYLINIVPQALETASDWKRIILKPEQKIAFAESALGLKWDSEESFPVTADQLITPRRIADQSNDLWTTFNILQENIIQGGLRYRTDKGARNRTRGVTSVSENVRLNTALWSLTEKMAELTK